jgi:hypothetical protein
MVVDGSSDGIWYVGRVQRIRRRYGKKWGVSRQPIDLQNRPTVVAKRAAGRATEEVMLNWFSKPSGCRKFTHDCTNTTWVDVDSIVYTVCMSYDKQSNVYWLDANDYDNLNDFVKDNFN